MFNKSCYFHTRPGRRNWSAERAPLKLALELGSACCARFSLALGLGSACCARFSCCCSCCGLAGSGEATSGKGRLSPTSMV